MPKSWRSKALISLSITLVSLYLLAPTIGRFEERRERTQAQSLPVPLWLKLFPREEIKLGLDLQGGIYVELEVEEDDALKNRVDLITSEIQRLIQKEAFAPQSIDRSTESPKSNEIKVALKKPEDLPFLKGWMRENYNNVLKEKTGESADPPTVFFHLTEGYADQIKDMAVRQALETIRNRIDRYGVSEPSIVRLGSNRIAVELPGMSDPDRALSLIKKGGRLEFRLVDEGRTDDEVRRLVSEAQSSLNLSSNPQGDYTEEAVARINQELKTKIPEGDEVLFEVQYDPVTKKIVGGNPYLLRAKAEVTGEMLKNAQVNIQDNEPYVSLSFNNLGTRLFGDLTKANVGKRLAIVLDGNVSKAPVIKSEIPSGEAQITLGFGDYRALLKEAEDLTLVLREGALPARLKELTKTVVGPSLGRDSIRRGVQTSLVAALLIAVFMVFYYRLSGLLADIALFLNVLFVLACLALFQATLTLPGLAGIVLTIGMAVDANVLIFERLREEVRAGKAARFALQEGYKHAMSAIIDSNITTFLSGVVLYQFGTGPIRGFAVTLMIGIVTTMFTAIIVTRILQEGILFGLKRESLSL